MAIGQTIYLASASHFGVATKAQSRAAVTMTGKTEVSHVARLARWDSPFVFVGEANTTVVVRTVRYSCSKRHFPKTRDKPLETRFST